MLSSVFKSIPMKKYVVSYIVVFLVTTVILSALSVIFSFFPPSEAILDLTYEYCGIFSALLAAILCARKCSSHGYLVGAVSACMYTCILMLAGCIAKCNIAIPDDFLIKCLLSAISGIVGGIIGINCK